MQDFKFMIPWDRINQLRGRSAELKLQGDFAAMLPLRVEAARLLEEHHADATEVATAWNYVAYVNLEIGDFEEAERAARRSLSHYLSHSPERDERLATYLWMLSRTLEELGHFSAALPHAEEAVALFTCLHREDDFVSARRADLEKLRKLT
jgi:tetratricopeptide (TPR) repeat protein